MNKKMSLVTSNSTEFEHSESSYIPPYGVVGLTPNTYFIKHRDEIPAIIKEIEHLAECALFTCYSRFPTKLMVLTEGCIQGFRDELIDMDPKQYHDDIAIDIDGPEVKAFGELAKKLNVFLAFQARTRLPEFPGQYFNENILVDDEGKVILRHFKNSVLYPVEHSTTPHDVLDKWIELKGDGLDAFFPVAKTKLSNNGFCMAMEGSYPEYVRGVAMNGCEVMIRMCIPAPFNDKFELQNRAHGLNNTMYVVGNQAGQCYAFPEGKPIDMMGGGSHLIDYTGEIIAQKPPTSGMSFFSGEINIDSLREFRIASPVMSWIKDLRPEIIRPIYARPILPANTCLEKTAYNAPQYTQVLNKQVKLMIERGIYTPPSNQNWEKRIVGESQK